MNPVGIQELQNRPRYDLDGRRYGNTLSDDMFSIKNPEIRPNQHTPESYQDLKEPREIEPPAIFNPAFYSPEKIPTLQDYFDNQVTPGAREDFRDNGVSRKKTVTEGIDGVYRAPWGMVDEILEFPEYYSQDEINWAAAREDKELADKRRYDLSTEGLRDDLYYASNPDAYRDEYMSPRRDADIDYYLGGELVNYNALSPETLKQLAKMGVNRPEDFKEPGRVADVGHASDYLNYLVGVYQDLMAKGVVQ